MALPREFSDHSLVVLRTHFISIGAPPFRFYNSWLRRDVCDAIVLKAWEDFNGGGAIFMIN